VEMQDKIQRYYDIWLNHNVQFNVAISAQELVAKQNKISGLRRRELAEEYMMYAHVQTSDM